MTYFSLSVITAPRVANIQSAIEFIYPLVVDFNAGPRSVNTKPAVNEAQLWHKKRRFENRVHVSDNSVMDDSEGESSDEEFDSDESQD